MSDLTNLAALVNVQNAALLAVFMTHPEPEKLREAFARYSETHFEVTDAHPEAGALQQTWTDVYLQALKMNPKLRGGASPPPA